MLHSLNARALALSTLTLVLVFLLWDMAIIYPLKLFVVLLHEISHGLAAILTGGSIESLHLTPNEGGLAYTRGGSQILTLSAGYLGSSLWGAALLLLSATAPLIRQRVLFGMGALLGLTAFLYSGSIFTLLYILLTAAMVLLLALKAPPMWHKTILYIVGTVSCLYAVVDIGTDILAGGPGAWLFGPRRINDAEMLAGLTWIPAFVWGVLWILIAVGVYALTLSYLARRPSPLKSPGVSPLYAARLLDEIDRL